MSDKIKTVLAINHQLGRIALYPAVRTQSTLRVRRLPDDSLETLGRPHGGQWTKAHAPVHAGLLRAIQQFLVKQNLSAYFYLDKNNVEAVNRRFTRVKQKA